MDLASYQAKSRDKLVYYLCIGLFPYFLYVYVIDPHFSFDIMIWAMNCGAHFGLLRISELTYQI